MYDICAVGNALVDILVQTDDAFLKKHNIAKGAMTLVDESTAKALYEKAGPAVELSSGGSAANTLAGASSLGASCAFIGRVGLDEFGNVFRHDLVAQNVHFNTQGAVGQGTGRCLILVTPDAQRSMNTYLGASVEFCPDDVDARLVQNAQITYLEGYLFDKPCAQEAFTKAAKLAHTAHRKVSMTLSDVFCVARHRDAFLNLIRSDIDILFANEAEINALCQCRDLGDALPLARTKAEIVVITRGAQGAVICAGNQTVAVEAHPAPKVIDTTGAGDLFAAGFLYGITHGKDLAECGRLGAIAASEIISHFGPRPQRSLKGLV